MTARSRTGGRWASRALLLVVLAVVAVLAGRKLFAPEAVPVTTVGAERGRVEATVTNSRAGTVKARRRAKLSPDAGGQVVAIPFREGERVAAGDVVLELESATQTAGLELARQELAAATAERERACLAAELAARELRRTARLAEEQIVSGDLLDRAETARLEADAACRSAAAQVGRAEAAVAVARTELAKRVLRAPFAGVVAEVATEIGEWVTPSPPAVPVPAALDILDPGSVYVSAPMDEVDSARIQAGQPARVTVDSHPGRSLAARVERVSPYVLDLEAQNRTVEIDLVLEDAAIAGELLPGTSADVEVVLEVRDDVLRLPTPALLEGDRVLVLSDGRLVERSLEVGLRNWDFSEITSGLEAGDRVVTSLDRAEVVAGAAAREAAAEGE